MASHGAHSWKLRHALLAAAWFGMAAGIAESAVIGTLRHLVHGITYRSLHYTWMPAASDILLFVGMVTILWAVGWIWPSARSRLIITGALIGTSAFSILMVTRTIHALAAFALAAGMASLATPLLARPRHAIWMARSLPVLAILVASGAAASFAATGTHEMTTRIKLAPGATARNVVLLILDTVRAESLDLYGRTRATAPNLRAFAERGTTFDLAIAPAPWTLPTHAAAFTGREVYELSVDHTVPLAGSLTTLAEVLAANGYSTAGFVGNLAFLNREFGLHQGFQKWDAYPINLTQVFANSSIGRFLLLEGFNGGRNSRIMRVLGIDQWIGHTRPASDINSHILDWLDDHPSRPFFIFANYFDAHMPYAAPAGYLGRFGPVEQTTWVERMEAERTGGWIDRGPIGTEQTLLNRYEEEIAYLDSEIGKLLHALEARDLLRNTLVVITADHGEAFGEHQDYEHDSSVYFNQIRVPLIIVSPNQVPAGARVDDPVSLADLPATITDLALGDEHLIAGHSLEPLLWAADEPHPVVSILKKGRVRSRASLVTDRYQYIRTADGHELLFDLETDPQQQTNIAEMSDLLPTLRDQLLRRVGANYWEAKRNP